MMLPQSHVLDLIARIKDKTVNINHPKNFNDFVEKERRGKLNAVKNYNNGWAVVNQYYDSKNSKFMINKVVSLHKSLDDVDFQNLQKEDTLYPITKDIMNDHNVTGWSRFADMSINEEVDVFANMRGRVLDYMIQQTLSKSKTKPSEQQFMQMKAEIKQELANMPTNDLIAQYNKILGIKS